MMDDKLVRLSHAISAAKTGADDWDGGCNIERDRYIEKAFADLPAVDAVEVVRCRQCTRFAINPVAWTDDRQIICFSNDPEGFCHNGTPREEGGDGNADSM